MSEASKRCFYRRVNTQYIRNNKQKNTLYRERNKKMRKINFASFKELPKHVFVCWIISMVLCALAIIFLSLDIFAGMWTMHNPGMLMLIVAQSMNFFFICKYRDKLYNK